jgi:hypothetical protein
MEIKKRNLTQPLVSSVVWLQPTVMYSLLKTFDQITRNEWVWWVWIPTTIIVWFVLNYKISKNN